MEVRLFVICIILHYTKYVTSQRISEIKCYEYSQISRNLTKQFAHMAIWEIQQTKTSSISAGYAVLVSDQFLVTVAETKSRSVPRNFQNWFISRVNFSSDESFKVAERIVHPFYSETFHNIGLLKLEHRIQINSLRRPACLWTKHCNKPASLEIIFWDDASPTWSNYEQFNIFDIKTLQFRIDTDVTCYPYQNETLACFQLQSPEEYRRIAAGSPIQTYKPFSYLPNNYYIYGIVTPYYYLDDLAAELNITKRVVGTTIAASIDWIESIVWPSEDTSCGRVQTDNVKPLILHSSPTTPGEFPWHAAIYYLEGFGRNYKCGGSLLNEITVITAAHCITTINGIISPDSLMVILGKYDLILNSLDSRESRVRRIFRHELYSTKRLENDIAILKLRTSMSYSEYIQPICITSNSRFFDKSIGVLPGWGLNEHQELQSILAKGSFPVRSSWECRDLAEVLSNFLFDNNFCAGYQNGTMACTGDSGGGLVFKVENRWFLIGITSLGSANAETRQCDALGLALFTDVIKYHDWIFDKL